MQLADVLHIMRRHLQRMPQRAVERGMPPAWLGWRWRVRERLDEYLAQTGQPRSKRIISWPRMVFAPLPRNIPDRRLLAEDRSLRGYAMRDVPERMLAETCLARIGAAQILFCRTKTKGGCSPAIITADGIALELSGIAYHPDHGAMAAATSRGRLPPQRFGEAVWILEHDWSDHAHWLTAHLPKLLLLNERGLLGQVLMPQAMNRLMEQSLRMLGIDPAIFRRFDPTRAVEVEDLTLIITDRCDPVHMRSVREAFADPARYTAAVSRRVFATTNSQRFANEAELLAMLRPRGFETMNLDDLAFADQVALMQDTRVLLCATGAGLANMLFCPEAGHVVELADPGDPDPAFYSLASGLGLHYWHLHAQAKMPANPHGAELTVDLPALREVLDQIG
jgi:hypothetical protein